MTDVSCEWQHCFGKKGQSSFPALPSEGNSSHQVCRFLTNIHLLFYKEDMQSNFAKKARISGSQSLFFSLPEKVSMSETCVSSSRIWGLVPSLGALLWHLGRLIQTSEIQMSKSVPDFPERQCWVGLHFQLSPWCIRDNCNNLVVP